jgi:hypothetical protein
LFRPITLRLAAGMAVVLIAVFVGERFVEPRRPVPAMAKHSPVAAVPERVLEPAPPTTATEAMPAIAHRPGRSRRTIRPEAAQAATRILFTAPEGTRILWFVGPPPASEERS